MITLVVLTVLLVAVELVSSLLAPLGASSALVYWACVTLFPLMGAAVCLSVGLALKKRVWQTLALAAFLWFAGSALETAGIANARSAGILLFDLIFLLSVLSLRQSVSALSVSVEAFINVGIAAVVLATMWFLGWPVASPDMLLPTATIVVDALLVVGSARLVLIFSGGLLFRSWVLLGTSALIIASGDALSVLAGFAHSGELWSVGFALLAASTTFDKRLRR